MDTLTPPNAMTFTGNISESWKKWKQRWNLYSRASGVNGKEEEIQSAILLHVIGEEGVEIYNTFEFEDADKDKIKPLIQRFEEYCVPKTNVTFERYKFNMRSQNPDENCDQYVTELKNMAATCEYGTLKNDLVKDRIVIGVRDNDLRRRLLREPDLTLVRAVQLCQMHEASNNQIKSMDTKAVSEVLHHKKRYQAGKSQPESSGKSHPELCEYCGYRKHTKSTCPATHENCNLCKKKGHFAKCCPKIENVQEVTSEQTETADEHFFLGSVDDKNGDAPWRVDLTVNGDSVNFKIDSGADVTVMSESTYSCLENCPKLRRSDTSLDSPGGNISCKWLFEAKIQRNNKTLHAKCYVVPGLPDNLLSRSAAVELQLIARLDTVKTENDLYELDVFGELGELKTKKVSIQVKADTTPYSCCTSRRMPFPMLNILKDELERMERLNVIKEVTEPTDWCSPIVVVPKSQGKIRICVDLKRLNAAISREKYVLPTIDDVLNNLSGAACFSTLDASSGYWQLALDEESSKLTTFITPFGRYRFVRLPFGICSASEIFQREMSELLSEMAGVSVYQDDILVYGKDVAEHDKRLEEVFNIIEKSGLKLNQNKCKLRKSGLEFLGHWIDRDGVKIHPSKIAAIKDMEAPQDVQGVRRFLGMINYLGRFVKDLSTYTNPLNALLRKDRVWSWGPPL